MNSRKPIVAMSWAMRQNKKEDAVRFATTLIQQLNQENEVEKIIFPSMGTLSAVAEVTKNTTIGLGAQTIAADAQGEYSGEYSIESLVDCGGKYVELGHWERRELYGETDEQINKKLRLAIEYGISPILCVGEKEKELETLPYSQLKRQLFNALFELPKEQLAQVIIAYTPQWAVGQTRAASAPHIHEVGRLIRSILEEFYPSKVVQEVRVIYGGSVSPENARLITSDEGIDGVLVGRFGSEPHRYAEVVSVIEENKLEIR
ncbi:triose-phosphate isomerase [Enterococcus phoeniculicola]|jgi:triosephosphate isomerase|uniref:Triosephosphate isomerase n=1 Tax=Enterococcus phoeniculicola ATCC BAA-412 TaxID=1158610 RepID=R3W6A4_9ENTE|nr:triose-phosphate isomerase [Enterococcus phoeniculicola]EOL43112.1 triose-phosphate isomerase [Enterococcus phoeniculicola ATCC BAA-412]EOT76530.1 triose-phosphate isomerase [Enterococcus phoeniculicola ATCC BAA-412]OJG71146.1 triose-phosphate isomerase [Enterococcus phoeniculicola]